MFEKKFVSIQVSHRALYTALIMIISTMPKMLRYCIGLEGRCQTLYCFSLSHVVEFDLFKLE